MGRGIPLSIVSKIGEEGAPSPCCVEKDVKPFPLASKLKRHAQYRFRTIVDHLPVLWIVHFFQFW